MPFTCDRCRATAEAVETQQVCGMTVCGDCAEMLRKSLCAGGKPAFPVQPGSVIPERQGMTLRDYFACAALHKTTTAGGHWLNPEVHEVRRAYRIADVMLGVREETSLPPIPWGVDDSACVAGMLENINTLNTFGQWWMNNNPRGTPQQRAAYYCGAMLLGVAANLRDAISESEGIPAAAGTAAFAMKCAEEFSRLCDHRNRDVERMLAEEAKNGGKKKGQAPQG